MQRAAFWGNELNAWGYFWLSFDPFVNIKTHNCKICIHRSYMLQTLHLHIDLLCKVYYEHSLSKKKGIKIRSWILWVHKSLCPPCATPCSTDPAICIPAKWHHLLSPAVRSSHSSGGMAQNAHWGSKRSAHVSHAEEGGSALISPVLVLHPTLALQVVSRLHVTVSLERNTKWRALQGEISSQGGLIRDKPRKSNL